MTAQELKVLNSLDIRKLNSDGRYVDVEIPLFFNLNYEQVKYLRELYNDNTIASNVKRPREDKERTEVRREVPRYKVTRNQKYNNGKHYTKGRVSFVPVTKIIVGVIVVSLSVGLLVSHINDKNQDNQNGGIAYVQEYDDETKSSNLTVEEPVDNSEYVDIQIDDGTHEVPEEQEIDVNGDLIREICNIYHVNYDVVYPFIKGISDNFSSQQYLNGTLNGVTCKGQEVCASSDRELLIYTVRTIKQLPQQIGISTEGLYGGDYQSGSDFANQISKVASDLGINRCLMYAIVQSETSFNSDLFINSNNPAGIKGIDGSWWVFDTKEEGFYELGMEILKYYRMIGIDPSVVNEDVISKIRDIHAPLSDGNQDWLPNVVSNYEYALMNEATLFDNNNVELVRK
ncbi:MAG TPA: hypothetical protein DCE23_06150 [Firmicutes bacterium]|nr:hypothetical protein [Bacillota bacterium]